MHQIIFIALLITTYNALFTMEPLHIEPSNSSSAICFFIKNIDSQYPLPEDVKKELIIKYSAITNGERMESSRYSNLISSADYMNLQKNNKLTIQIFHTNSPMTYVPCNNNKQLILSNVTNAYKHYEELLKLPRDVRCKIADRYSAMIFVKTKASGNHIIEGINTVIAFGIVAPLGYLLCGISIWSILMDITPDITLILQNKISPFPKGFEDYYDKGYDLLPLVPEDDKK